MTIDPALQVRIRRLADRHWQRHVQDRGFAEMVDGKEPGHPMADYVDDKTTALLKVELDTRYEGNVDGSVKKRSMGDIWVRSSGIYNPINVKVQDFYDAFDSGVAQPRRSIQDKVGRLFDLFERQVEALFENRRERLRRQRTELRRFDEAPFSVDQSGMRFVP